MALQRPLRNCIKMTTALIYIIAVVIVCAYPPYPRFALADTKIDNLIKRQLAAELLIARGDLELLNDNNLPQLHRDGSAQRIKGSLGVLPWLLRLNGNDDAANKLRTWQGMNLDDKKNIVPLANILEQLSNNYPLNTTLFENIPITATMRREAIYIHKTFCAGCHDGKGHGDPDERLPARDLFVMPLNGNKKTFLARLINGVKGDASIKFENPLSDAQVAALWDYYSRIDR